MSWSDEPGDPEQHRKAADTTPPKPDPVSPVDEPAAAMALDEPVGGAQADAKTTPPRPRASGGASRRAAKSGPPIEMVLVGVIVVMLLAIGTGAWFQRDRIAAMIGGGTGPQVAVAPPASTAPPQAAPPQPAAPATPAAEPAPVVAETPPAPPAAVAEPPPAPAVPAGPVVIFIEEPPGGVSESNPAIESIGQPAWRFVPADAAGPARIEVDVAVPVRGMDIGISITKVEDAGFPASHLLEITVRNSDVAIADVGQITAKPELRGRPQRFDAAGTKVADGLYWIALSDAPESIEKNVGLLRTEAYIDVLMMLDGDRRAILTIAVGDEGRQAIDQAFAAWGTG